ncbi:MAG: PfkB family carbohydrate kinase, partial [Planctomycetaceae bacterium]
MSEVEPPVVVGLGEVLWDCLPDGRLPGGAPANVAYHAAQLGCRGAICSRVGVDVLGDEYLAFASSRNLETAWIQRDRDHATGRADIQLDAQGQPEFVIQENVAWDFLEASQPAQSLILRASAVCFGTLAQRSEIARRSIQNLLAGSHSDCLLVYDVNLRQHWYQKTWIEGSLFLADIAKLNHDEALVLARVLELGVATTLEIANALQNRFDIRLVCITRGAQGCLLVTDQDHVDLP